MALNDDVVPIPGKPRQREANGLDQLAAMRDRNIADREVKANPVGPPALVNPPPVNNTVPAGVRVNPTGTDLYRDGALRPQSGPFSAANPQPEVDAGGNMLPARPRPSVSASLASAATPSTGAPPGPAGRAGAAITAAAPTLSVVTPASAANAADLTVAKPTVGGATSVNGRPLGYGAMVNGVRTFSDGRGGSNAPARTMTDAQMGDLAKERSLSRADAGLGGAIGSAAAGGTPELGAFGGGVGVARPRPSIAYDRAQSGNALAAANAASDMASIATGDTRSVLGRAARAARIDANSSFGSPRVRRVNFEATMDVLNKAAMSGVQPQADLGKSAVEQDAANARAALDDAGQTTRAGINANASIIGDMIRRPSPTTVNLANGNLGLLNPDGSVRTALDEKGLPVRPQIGKTPEEIASINKAVEDRTRMLLGIDPMTGLIPSVDPKQSGRQATAEELAQATRAARASLGVGQDGGGGAAPPPEAAEFLRKNPQYQQDFDKKYGAGASKRILGAS